MSSQSYSHLVIQSRSITFFSMLVRVNRGSKSLEGRILHSPSTFAFKNIDVSLKMGFTKCIITSSILWLGLETPSKKVMSSNETKHNACSQFKTLAIRHHLHTSNPPSNDKSSLTRRQAYKRAILCGARNVDVSNLLKNFLEKPPSTRFSSDVKSSPSVR